MVIRILLLCLLLAASLPAWAGNDTPATALGSTGPTVKQLQRLAKNGDTRAQYNLGVKYHNGQGVPRDYSQAARWYRLAANQGYMPAQYNLGVLHGNGEGVAHDIIEAHMWFSLAAGSGDAQAIENRDRTERILTPEQVEEARQLTHAWMEAHQPQK